VLLQPLKIIRSASRAGDSQCDRFTELGHCTLHQYFHDIVECLVTALEAKDPYTRGHSSRVADMSLDLAEAMGLRGKTLATVHMAAHLHDIGKIGIAESILNKTEKLLPHEWGQIRMHPEIGYDILRKSKALHRTAEVVLFHHERWDGRGYPQGLCQDKIPLGSRIISVADAIDAMTTERTYRQKVSWESCIGELMANRGTQFDPMVVEVAARLWKRLAERLQLKGSDQRSVQEAAETEALTRQHP